MFLKWTGVYAGLTVLCVPFFALAHATPTAYSPAASETVLEVPQEISVEFTERIEPGASSVSVYDPQGNSVGEGKGTIDPLNDRRVIVPLQAAGEGVYTVSWQVVSVDDGHFTKGAYSFLVNSEGLAYEGKEETVSVAYSASIEDALASFLNLVGESIFIAVFFLLLALPWLFNVPIPRRLLVNLALWGLVLFCMGAGLSILKKSFELASLQGVAYFDALSTYLGSSVGISHAVKIALACAFAAFFLFALKKPTLLRKTILLLLLCSILYVQSSISHAAASLFMPHLSVGMTFVHLFAKELVVGGVLVLCVLFFVFLSQKRQSEYIRIARLYDLCASAALLFAAASGAYITWLHLKAPQNLFMTSWGELFLVLLVCTLLLGFFRIFHQAVVHPRFSISRLRSLYAVTLPIEVLLALCVLFYSGYISMTTPPFTVEGYAYAESTHSEGIEIEMSIHPFEASMFLLTFKDASSGALMDPRSLTVFTQQAELGIGPNVLSTSKRYNGAYVFPRADLSLGGAWDIEISASFEDRYDAHATFEVEYPQEVEQTFFSDSVRTFDHFAALMCLIAALLVLLFGALTVSAAYAVKNASSQPPAQDTYSWKFAVLSVAVFMVLISGVHLLRPSSFQKSCVEEGFLWQMGYPTRDFQATSKNARLGCTVHEGHYHFADEREFHAYLMSLK